MKTYVLIISEYFPKSHIRSGELTNFIPSIKLGIKKHTIRSNFQLWEKRFEEIKKGNACISVRSWIGKPYKSKQKEHIVLTDLDGIGIEKVTISLNVQRVLIFKDKIPIKTLPIKELSKNDGLVDTDFVDWFKGVLPITEMAIIHFTKFRYLK